MGYMGLGDIRSLKTDGYYFYWMMRSTNQSLAQLAKKRSFIAISFC